MSVVERVKGIVAKQLSIGADEVKNESSFIDDLGADSLDTVELVMSLEEEFDIEIADLPRSKFTILDASLKEIEKRYKKAKKEYKTIKNTPFGGSDLMEGSSKRPEIGEMTEDVMFAYGDKM